MGCYNGTCAISNLHITAGQDVAVFMLLENKNKKSFCYGNAIYDVCPVPFYGEYDDYGGVENCNGFGVDLVVDAIYSRLYEFGQGPNSYHDIVVNKDNFDLEMLFKADHENRLGIQFVERWNNDTSDHGELFEKQQNSTLSDSEQFELDRLAAKIKHQDTFRRVTHVIVHGDVFRAIMDKWFVEEYVGHGPGNKGYENKYAHIYFKDIVDSIPAYVEVKRKMHEAESFNLPVGHDYDDWSSPNLAAKWISTYTGSNSVYGLINVKEYIRKYICSEDWEYLTSFITEVLTSAWINSFMTATRKVWTQQSGQGSQEQEVDAYILLSDTVKDILKAECEENDE